MTGVEEGRLCLPSRRSGGGTAAELGTASEAALAVLVHPPVGSAGDGADEPKQHIGEVDPDGVLHALNVAVALGVLFDVHVAKQAEERDPEHEDDEAPCGDGGEAQDEGDRVEDSRQGGQGAHNFSEDLACVLADGLLVGCSVRSSAEPDADCWASKMGFIGAGS